MYPRVSFSLVLLLLAACSSKSNPSPADSPDSSSLSGDGSTPTAEAGVVSDSGPVRDSSSSTTSDGAPEAEAGGNSDGSVSCPAPGQLAVARNLVDADAGYGIVSLAVDTVNVYAAVTITEGFLTSDDFILQIPLAGGAPTTILSDGFRLQYLQTDGTNVFVTDSRWGESRLEFVPVSADAGGVPTPYPLVTAGVGPFVLDGPNIVATFAGTLPGSSEPGDDGALWLQPKADTGTAGAPLISNGTYIVGVGAGGGLVDWIDIGTGESTSAVNQIAETGDGGVTALATGQKEILALTTGGGSVSWLTVDGNIHAIAQTNGTAKVVATDANILPGTSLFDAIAMDGTSIYYRGSGETGTTLRKVALAGGGSTILGCNADWLPGAYDPIAVDATSVYWTDGISIWKAPK